MSGGVRGTSRDRGDVVVATDPFGYTGSRPYLLVSADDHPFHGDEYLAAAITTTERDAAIALSGEYEAGELPRESFVSPWAVVTLKERVVDKRVASVSTAVVEAVGRAICSYVTPD